MHKLCRVIGVLLAVATGHCCFAQALSFPALETPDLRLVDGASAEYLQPHVARTFLNALEFHKALFDWEPGEQTAVVLRDSGDVGNGSAGPVPTNHIFLQVSPPSVTFETNPKLERMFSLFNHEVLHLATLDANNTKDRFWRSLFQGKPRANRGHPESIFYQYLVAPRSYSPAWFAEGSAVFVETWMSGGIGRAQSGYYEMVFRAKVRDEAEFYSNLGLVSEGMASDFLGYTNAYLYGTRFVSYLAYKYSPDDVIAWLKRDDASDAGFSDQFERVFGVNMQDEWDLWIEFEKSFQRDNLAAVREFPLTQARALARTGLGSVSRSFFDKKSSSIIGGFYYPGVLPHIGKYSAANQSLTNLVTVKGAIKFSVASTAFDEKGRRLFYTEDNSRKRDLMSVDVDTFEVKLIAKNLRVGDLAFNSKDNSLYGIRHHRGLASLVGIPEPYERVLTLHEFPYGTVMSNIDISNNGEYLSATMGDIQGKQNLSIFRIRDLIKGVVKPVRTFDFGFAIPEGFVFSPDDRYLFGTAYYTGVSNIFRWEIQTGDMEAVTNAETGFFRPIPLEDGSLLAFEYTGQGFIPVEIDPTPTDDLSAIKFLGSEIANKHPVVGTWGAGSPAGIDLDSMITGNADYVPIRELLYDAGYPILEGYRNESALGYSFNWTDPLLLNSAQLDLSYSWDDSISSDEKLHVDLQYKHLDWTLRYWHNNADFYDLFGPTERSRKGDAFIVSYDTNLRYDPPRRLDFNADLAYYKGLDQLPVNQNVGTPIEDLLSGNAAFTYSDLKKSQNAVDHENGYRWVVEALVDYADGTSYPKLHAGFDFGFQLPIKHSSLWLYNAAGIGQGDREEVFSNYYFGGFGNNYVDDEEVKRYREYDSFPGFEIGEIAARDFAKTVVELNLPPIRFAEIGIPAFYLGHIRPAIFAGALWTDPGSSLDEQFTTVGAQVDLSFTLLHKLPMTLSLGYAKGFASDNKGEGEWMLSLKIL